MRSQQGRSVPELRHVRGLDRADQPAAVQARGGAGGADPEPVRPLGQYRLADFRSVLVEVDLRLAQVRLRLGAGRRRLAGGEPAVAADADPLAVEPGAAPERLVR